MSRTALVLCAFFVSGVWLHEGPRQTVSRRAGGSNERGPATVERSGVVRGKYLADPWRSVVPAGRATPVTAVARVRAGVQRVFPRQAAAEVQG